MENEHAYTHRHKLEVIQNVFYDRNRYVAAV